MAVKHYYCGKVCFNCIITVQNIKTYFNQSHKLLAIHTFLQHKFGHTVSETSLELQQFCLLLLRCETYYIISGLGYFDVLCNRALQQKKMNNWIGPTVKQLWKYAMHVQHNFFGFNINTTAFCLGQSSLHLQGIVYIDDIIIMIILLSPTTKKLLHDEAV